MPVLLWGVLAIAVILGGIWIVARRAMSPVPPLPPDVELATTYLQRSSRWSLGVGVPLSAVAAGIILFYGPDAVYDNDNIRLVFTLLLLVILMVLAWSTVWVKMRAERDPSLVDERDQAILGRAPAVQGIAVILTLAAWMIGLVEHFHSAGAVPLFYLYLIFWSCLIVNLMALPIGILIGYRRQ